MALAYFTKAYEPEKALCARSDRKYVEVKWFLSLGRLRLHGQLRTFGLDAPLNLLN